MSGTGGSIAVDRDVCIGSGMCVTYAPGTFGQDQDAKVVVLDAVTDDAETIRSAVDACPTQAIRLTGSED